MGRLKGRLKASYTSAVHISSSIVDDTLSYTLLFVSHIENALWLKLVTSCELCHAVVRRGTIAQDKWCIRIQYHTREYVLPQTRRYFSWAWHVVRKCMCEMKQSLWKLCCKSFHPPAKLYGLCLCELQADQQDVRLCTLPSRCCERTWRSQ